MANVNAPQGFIPLRHLTGGVIRAQEYAIANSYAANLASGDLVTLTTDGTVIRGTAGGNAVGVFYGVEYIENSTGDVKFSKVWNTGTAVKANTAIKAYVYDDPNITYKVQCNGTFATANVGELANVTIGTYNSTFGNSTDELDIATLATTSKVLRILRLVDEPNNAAGADAKVEVVINKSLYGVGAAGAGV
jgi:hypothetical protein